MWFSRQRAGHKSPAGDNMQKPGVLKTWDVYLHQEKMSEKAKEGRRNKLEERKERTQYRERDEGKREEWE